MWPYKSRKIFIHTYNTNNVNEETPLHFYRCVNLRLHDEIPVWKSNGNRASLPSCVIRKIKVKVPKIVKKGKKNKLCYTIEEILYFVAKISI